MEEELDSFDRKKREISNHFLQMDPAPTRMFEDEMPEELDDYISNEPDDGASTLTADTAILQDIQLPMKAGSPAFKIIASKVYILYPSMFQDPNIFGRFSIPQSINMEGKGDLSMSKDVKNNPSTMDPTIPSMASASLPPSPSYLLRKQQYEPQESNNQQYQEERQGIQNDYPSKRMNYRRQPIPIPTAEPTELADPLPQPTSDNARERSIQTHMRGQIVVQNQDVNEYNTQKGY